MKTIKRYYYFLVLLTILAGFSIGCSSSHDGSGGALGAPENLAASDKTDCDKIIVTWDAVSGAASYEIFRKGPADSDFVKIRETPTICCYDRDVSTGNRYEYKVRGKNSGNETGYWGGPVTGSTSIISAPTKVDATDGTFANAVTITWEKSSGAKKYFIYRCRSTDNAFESIGESAGLTFNDTTVGTGVIYKYAVAGVDTTGKEGPHSSFDTGYAKDLLHSPITATTSVKAGNATDVDRIPLSWSKISDCDAYYIYRKECGTNDLILLSVSHDTEFADTRIESGKFYSYAIRLFYDEDGFGPLSDYDTGYCLINPFQLSITVDGIRYQASEFASREEITGITQYLRNWYKSMAGDTASPYGMVATNNSRVVSFTSVAKFDDDIKDGFIIATCSYNSDSGSYTTEVTIAYKPDNYVSGFSVTAKSELLADPMVGILLNDKFSYCIDNGWTVILSKGKTKPDIGSFTGSFFVFEAADINSHNTYAYSGLENISNVSPTSSVKISFKDNNGQPIAMDANNRDIYINDAPVQGVWSVDGYTLSYTPSVPFEKNARVTVDVPATHKSGTGQPLFRPYNFTFTTQPTYLAPPNYVNASDGDYTNMIQVSWQNLNGSYIYYVYRSTDESQGYVKIAETANSCYNDNTTNSGTLYYYKIVAYDSSQSITSAFSPTDSGFNAAMTVITPGTTLNLQFNGQNATWLRSDVSVNEAYNVYIDDSIEGSSAYDADVVMSAYYTDGLSILPYVSGKDNTFYVPYQFNAKTTSLLIKIEKRNPLAGERCKVTLIRNDAASPPSSVNASDIAQPDMIMLQWSMPATGAVRYNVYRSRQKYGAYSFIGSTQATQFLDNTVEKSVVYFYKIQSVTSNGSISLLSTDDSGMTSISLNNAINIAPSDFGSWISYDLTAGTTMIFYLNTVAGENYFINWDDAASGSGDKTCDISVSSYGNTSAYFINADGGYTGESRTVTVIENGKMTIVVSPYDATGFGTFALKVTKN